jgi:molybdopterin-guanine dinucleotide biosynthesis protein A
MSQRVGVVLAGGSSQRLGRAKGDLDFAGDTLAQHAANAVWPLCASVLISVGPGGESPAAGFPVVRDRPPAGRGPLAGIDAAFRITGDADLVVLACDYPRVESDFLRRIVEEAEEEDDIVMPVDPRGRDHPLVALWHRRTAPVVAEALREERLKVRALLADCRVKRLQPQDFPGLDTGRILLNLNRPSDLETLRKGGRDPMERDEWPE